MEDSVQAALQFANEVRGKIGLEPLDELRPGKKLEPECCPISSTVTYGAEGIHADTCAACSVWGGVGLDRVFGIPTAVSGFMDRFDSGEFPELELADQKNVGKAES